MTKNAIVILSGGPDSTAAAMWAIAEGYEVSLLTFQFRDDAQYGELFASMCVAAELGRPHKIIDFKSPINAFTPNMHIMMHAGVKPLGLDKSQPYLMPFGSGTLLSFAASYAIHEGFTTVIWGATADDANAHWEYSKDFCNQLSNLIRKSTGQEIEILVPFAQKHKPEIFNFFEQKKGIFEKTWSCRASSNLQCGECEGCTARRVAADLAGTPDSTPYKTTSPAYSLGNLKKRALSEFTERDWQQVRGITPMSCARPG